MPKEELRELFHSINGILFTGGGLTLREDTEYYQTAKFLYHLALQANDQGEFFFFLCTFFFTVEFH